MSEPDHVRAHKQCSNHRAEVEASEACGCFYCLEIFSPANIDIWCDDDKTAVCPRCGIDSVIGSASGFPITVDFLRAMHEHWF